MPIFEKEITKLSKKFEKIIERVRNSEERKEIFTAYCEILKLIQEIKIKEVIYDKKVHKIIKF